MGDFESYIHSLGISLVSNFQHIDGTMPNLEFRLNNVRVVRFAGKPWEREIKDPTKQRKVFGNYSTKDGGATIDYGIEVIKGGDISITEYFTQKLKPLLINYTKQQDHNEIFKYLSYLEYFSRKDPGNFFLVKRDFKKLIRKLDCPVALCDISSAIPTLRNLPEDLTRRISKLQIWTPIADGFKPMCTPHDMKYLLEEDKINFRARAAQLIIDYNIPILGTGSQVIQ